jgi:hypothetical protein
LRSRKGQNSKLPLRILRLLKQLKMKQTGLLQIL